jgi:hypothetical protein
MARKTRVSFTRGMIVATAKKVLMPELRQNGVVDGGGGPCIGLKISTMRGKYPTRTASHKPAKKPITHG